MSQPQQASVRPLRRYPSSEAFGNAKQNRFGSWPRVDDADNRFASVADPAFKPKFMLEPGQRIFTIGSCFARNVELALINRGFDVPARDFVSTHSEIGTESILNNYVPASIAPQIRWAFGLEPFEIKRHCAEVRPGRFVDLQLVPSLRPLPADEVLARRAKLNSLYRMVAESQVVLITLGLVEAWFDRDAGRYINMAPPKSVVRNEPNRFELHVLEYNQILRDLQDVIALLGQVCPADHRVVLTVSPVPITLTFTADDVAVANMYSKSVLRAAVEAITSAYAHVTYFPSYESVVMSDRALAYGDDQVHVTPQLVKFNVDRMVAAFVKDPATETSGDIIERALNEQKAGQIGTALRILRTAWDEHRDDEQLLIALAQTYFKTGHGEKAEQILTSHMKTGNAAGHLLLARYYNEAGRLEAAAVQAESAAATGKLKLQVSLARVEAYHGLNRCREALGILDGLRYVANRAPFLEYWKARLCWKLGEFEEAEDHFVRSNSMTERAEFMLEYGAFLLERERRDEASTWLDRALLLEPTNLRGLVLRAKAFDHGLHAIASRLPRWRSALRVIGRLFVRRDRRQDEHGSFFE